jgi:hypothetical protein
MSYEIIQQFKGQPEVTATIHNSWLTPKGIDPGLFRRDYVHWQTLKDRYESLGHEITISRWREIVSGQNQAPEIKDVKIDLDFHPIDSYTVQLLRQGLFPEFQYHAILAPTITKDEKVILAVRGGDVETGKRSIAPTGVIPFDKSSDNPIIDAYLAESRQELDPSATFTGTIKAYVLHNNQPKWVVVSQVNRTFQELDELHKEAIAIYEESKRKSSIIGPAQEQQARNAIKNHSHLPPDAWEAQHLRAIENYPGVIRESMDHPLMFELGKAALEVLLLQ